MDDVWRFDLLKFEWSKLDTKLPIGVFFHSAAVTSVFNFIIIILFFMIVYF